MFAVIVSEGGFFLYAEGCGLMALIGYVCGVCMCCVYVLWVCLWVWRDCMCVHVLMHSEKDTVDLIMEQWSGANKTRGQIIRHLKHLHLINSVKDIKKKPQ